MISIYEHAALRGKISRYEEKLVEMYGKDARSHTVEEIVATGLPVPTNDERSAVEMYELANGDPVKYHCYLGRTGDSVTTWTGEKIGSIVHEGKTWRDNFGGLRMSVRVRLCNGRMYSGFVNGYDGVNLKIMKEKKS